MGTCDPGARKGLSAVMFELNVLKTRWLILTFGAGLILVLGFFLSYLPMKRPRHPERYQSIESAQPRSWREVFSYMPWVLVLTYVGIMVYGAAMLILKTIHPPNY